MKEKKLNYRFHNPNTMEATISHLLEIFIEANAIKAKQAIEKAEKEFEAYRAREMRELESDFDRAIKQLEGK